MSANINSITYIDATPWHGLGDNIIGEMQRALPAERISLARARGGLDYQVTTEGIRLADSGLLLDSHKATVRVNQDGTRLPLGIVGKGYEVIQNEQATELLEVMAREWGAVPAVTGALGDGEKAWMLMRLADAQVSPLPGDDVRGYALAHWGHGGDNALTIRGTSVRAVCQNTINLAFSSSKPWVVIKHTTSASARLDQAAKVMGQLMQTMAATGETFASMAAKALTPAQLDAFIAQVIPNTTAGAKVAPVIQARRDTIALLVHGGRGAALANQLVSTQDGSASAWAAVNAVSEYFDHVRPGEAKSDAGRANANVSAIFGGNADIKAQAYAAARELVLA
jgi:phage/plasmid-like protein (TIGR03299 family)